MTTIKELCRPGGGVWRPHKTESKLSVEEQFIAVLVCLRKLARDGDKAGNIQAVLLQDVHHVGELSSV